MQSKILHGSIRKKSFWDSMDDGIKIRTKEYPEGSPFRKNKFIIHKYKAKAGIEPGRGSARGKLDVPV